MGTNIWAGNMRALCFQACRECREPSLEVRHGKQALRDAALDCDHRANEAGGRKLCDGLHDSGNQGQFIQALLFQRFNQSTVQIKKYAAALHFPIVIRLATGTIARR
jgi:hypothetical protein